MNLQSNKRVLTVDATLTDTDDNQTISIVESISLGRSTYALPLQKAKVEILVNGTERIPLTEKSGGIYALPPAFRTKAGNTYKLFFQKPDGTKYESGEEKMIGVPEITKVYDEFVDKGIARGDYFDAANYIYLDTQDPINEKNNYLWTWKLWEQQDICITCMGGRFFTSPFPGVCKQENAFKDDIFDYSCNGKCWDILYSVDLNVLSDIFSNGNPIIGRLVAKIPYYSRGGSLIEIKQQSISPDAYRYFKLLADQVQNNGSLVDTPPAAIIGNVKNMSDPNESIAGFFMTTSVRTTRYWISRKNASAKAIAIGLLDHTIIYEPAMDPPDPLRPPLAPCIEGRFRTPTRPNGWIN